MKLFSFGLVLVLFLLSCKKEQKGLKKLDKYEVLARARSNDFSYIYAKFKDSKGNPISKEDKRRLNKGLLAKDYYQDKDGKIVEVWCRELTNDDKLFEILFREAGKFDINSVATRSVDCHSEVDSLLNFVKKTESPGYLHPGISNRQIDSANQVIVLSVIQSCGWGEKHHRLLWQILDGAPMGMMSYFYPEMKKLANLKKMDLTFVSKVEDRMLLRYHYNQIYGTQLKNGHLHPIDKPEIVDHLRDSVGLKPIQQFLDIYGLDYNKELEFQRLNEKNK